MSVCVESEVIVLRAVCASRCRKATCAALPSACSHLYWHPHHLAYGASNALSSPASQSSGKAGGKADRRDDAVGVLVGMLGKELDAPMDTVDTSKEISQFVAVIIA